MENIGLVSDLAIARKRSARRSAAAVLASAFVAFIVLPFPAHSVPVVVTNLVTDDQAVNPASITDPDLKNPWGVSYAPTSPFWVSDNGTGKSTLYSVNPTSNATSKVALVVSIPGAGNPTGQVFNGSAANFQGNNFIFVSEDGTVSGWRGALGTTAETLKLGSANNVYKGSALATVGQSEYLYAANFKAGTIDVVPGVAGAPALTGNFTDPNLPAGYAPFNIQNIGGNLYVTYAVQDAAKEDDVKGAGNGVVDVFDTQGNLVSRFTAGGPLNSPWGMAIAPSSFGALAGKLLIGNFGDGTIHAFDPTTHQLLGAVTGKDGKPIAIDGLWALMPGNGGAAGSDQSIFFTAGPNDEKNGLFGVLSAVPEPSAYALLGVGLIGLYIARRRKLS
jgi:uncharacterized protein (TIGR03118 family)